MQVNERPSFNQGKITARARQIVATEDAINLSQVLEAVKEARAQQAELFSRRIDIPVYLAAEYKSKAVSLQKTPH